MIPVFEASRNSKFIKKVGKNAEFTDNWAGDKIVCRYTIWDENALD
jgi:hypothetical protein